MYLKSPFNLNFFYPGKRNGLVAVTTAQQMKSQI